MKWFCMKKNKIHQQPSRVTYPELNIIYHGTLNNFIPSEINSPSWFSIEEDQSVKWIYYKYKKNNCVGLKTGYLHKFKVINNPNLLDVNTNTNYRLEINAHGNNNFSKRIMNGDFGSYDGYINLEDQAEIMLCTPSKFLKVIETTKIQIEKVYDLSYQKTSKGWRL